MLLCYCVQQTTAKAYMVDHKNLRTLFTFKENSTVSSTIGVSFTLLYPESNIMEKRSVLFFSNRTYQPCHQPCRTHYRSDDVVPGIPVDAGELDDSSNGL